MRWGSLRLRLTLWNLALMGLFLIVFGNALNALNQSRIQSQIDRDLVARAEQFRHGPPPPPPGGGGPGPIPQTGPGPAGPPPDMPPLDRYDPLGYLRRPQFYDVRGLYRGPDGYAVPFDRDLINSSLHGQALFASTFSRDEHIRVYSAPVEREGTIAGVVQVARELRPYDDLWRAHAGTLLLLIPIGLVAAGIGAMFLTNRALKPVGAVTRTASEISAKDLSKRLSVSGNDELAELANTFNAMIGRLEESFVELEKALEAQRRFTADASHELKTPLTRLRLATSSTLTNPEDVSAVLTSLKTADEAGASMAKLVQQLLVLSRADSGDLGLVKISLDLRTVITAAIDAVPAAQGVDLAVELPQVEVRVQGDPDHLERVVINLLENACRYTTDGGRVTVSLVAEGSAVIKVSDMGEGIAPEHLAKVFDRFYRADAARSRSDGGAGLGLSIAKSIVEAHGGSISIASRMGMGTVGTVELPIEPAAKKP